MRFFYDVSKNCKTSCKRCIFTMFLQTTVKCEKSPILKKYFFLPIGYTEDIRAVNYHFFVQKSAQYRHKILNVCVKVCNMEIPKTIGFWNLKHRLKHRTFCLTMWCFNDVSENCKTSCKRCILKMFLQRTVKCEKALYWEIFFLQIWYTEEIRAVNYHFFVQKSAQYRHKILNVCVKVCIKTRPKNIT